MKRPFSSLGALALVLTLASCGPGRAAADAKLSSACLAAVKMMHGPDDTYDIKDTVFQSEKSTEKTNLRVVRIHALYTQSHGVLQDKDYSCAFEETSGLFGYKAAFYRMEFDDQKLGNFDGHITGDLDQMVKINQAMSEILQ